MGTLWWRAKLYRATEALATVDRGRGVPLSEEVFDQNGNSLGTVFFDKYKKIPDVTPEAWVPLQIVVMMAASNNNLRKKMMYEFNYQLIEKDIWFFRSSTAQEVKANEEVVECSHAFAENILINR